MGYNGPAPQRSPGQSPPTLPAPPPAPGKPSGKKASRTQPTAIDPPRTSPMGWAILALLLGA